MSRKQARVAYRSTDRTQQHKLARNAALVEAGHELVAEGGFAAATIARVAERAGVSTGSVYTYFPDKASLSAAIFERAAGIELEVVRAAVAFGADARLLTPAVDRLDALVRVFGARALRGRTLATALLFEAADVGVERERLVFRRAYTETVAEILADGVREGALRAGRIDLLAPAVVGAIGEAVIRPLAPVPGGPGEHEEVLETLATACQRLAGFAVLPPHERPAANTRNSRNTH